MPYSEVHDDKDVVKKINELSRLAISNRIIMRKMWCAYIREEKPQPHAGFNIYKQYNMAKNAKNCNYPACITRGLYSRISFKKAILATILDL